MIPKLRDSAQCQVHFHTIRLIIWDKKGSLQKIKILGTIFQVPEDSVQVIFNLIKAKLRQLDQGLMKIKQ